MVVSYDHVLASQGLDNHTKNKKLLDEKLAQMNQ